MEHGCHPEIILSIQLNEAKDCTFEMLLRRKTTCSVNSRAYAPQPARGPTKREREGKREKGKG